ncbi:hypothetical protein IQ266_20005 [filamentous cyanobacterium LEGE 11480]|uniref:Uncharacterized protein n=1 Tax=Romeriopsis navalis LEGE 11480 TaxID=2777977 RepID=A0A928VPD0_9CYAN|nr:hypothetical protein [Romeriopsis navalis]MBE9032025.1 hypothetical protein [Romeriopsis navalis LEGE 11480]
MQLSQTVRHFWQFLAGYSIAAISVSLIHAIFFGWLVGLVAFGVVLLGFGLIITTAQPLFVPFRVKQWQVEPVSLLDWPNQDFSELEQITAELAELGYYPLQDYAQPQRKTKIQAIARCFGNTNIGGFAEIGFCLIDETVEDSTESDATVLPVSLETSNIITKDQLGNPNPTYAVITNIDQPAALTEAHDIPSGSDNPASIPPAEIKSISITNNVQSSEPIVDIIDSDPDHQANIPAAGINQIVTPSSAQPSKPIGEIIGAETITETLNTDVSTVVTPTTDVVTVEAENLHQTPEGENTPEEPSSRSHETSETNRPSETNLLFGPAQPTAQSPESNDQDSLADAAIVDSTTVSEITEVTATTAQPAEPLIAPNEPSVTRLRLKITHTVFFTVFDQGWMLIDGNFSPHRRESLIYAWRNPREVRHYHPHLNPTDTCDRHLGNRQSMMRRLNIQVNQNISWEAYREVQKELITQPWLRLRRRNLLTAMIDATRFEKKPAHEWLGEYRQALNQPINKR